MKIKESMMGWATLFAALSVAQVSAAMIARDYTTITILNATFTIEATTTQVIPLPTSTTSCASTSIETSPSIYDTTYTATEIYAFRPDSPIHLLPVQAAGYVFRLGGANAAFCPSFAEEIGACGHMNITAFNNCSLSTVVPGGQSVYLAPDGSVRYTAPHSQYMIPGSVICPLSFTPIRDSDATEIGIAGFGAAGFMACPMLNSTRVRQQWQVYGNISDATVPLRHGDVSDCISFEAVGIEKNLGHTAAAWEYA